MKPESIKYLLDCYIMERSSLCDEVDGIYSSDGVLSGECMQPGGRHRELFMSQMSVEAAVEDAGNLNAQELDQARRVGHQLAVFANNFVLNPQQHAEAGAGNNFGNSTLQFSERSVQVSAKCEKAQIVVTRTGSTDNDAKAKWKTSDITAISGIHFIGESGEIIFSSGDVEKEIQIQILNNLHQGKDARFLLELFNPENVNLGPVSSIIVFIVDHDDFYPDEKQVVENMKQYKNSNRYDAISHIASCLQSCFTPRTFLAALQFVCNDVRTVEGQLTLAFELARFVSYRVRREMLYRVLGDYFKSLPELEEILQNFHGDSQM